MVNWYILYTCTQDEKALYDAAQRGDVSTMRQLFASHVNVDCTPYGVCGTLLYMYYVELWDVRTPFVDIGVY